jgi:hypothetical protein
MEYAVDHNDGLEELRRKFNTFSFASSISYWDVNVL